MFDGSFFQLAADDALFRATSVAAAGLLLVTGLVAVIATLLHVRSDLRKRRHNQVDKEWSPVIKAALAGRVDPAAAVANIDADDRGHFLRLLLRSARQGTDRETNILKQMAAPFLEDVRKGRPTEAPEAQAIRMQLLGWLGDERDVPQLVEALEDPSPLVAVVAMRALIRRRQTEAIERVVANLDRFKFWNMRTIASMLAEFGAPIGPSLRTCLSSSNSDMRVRLIALTTLEELGGETAAQTAVELLTTTRERPLVTGSLRILEAAGDRRHLALLREMTRSDDEIVRLRAYAALSAIDAKSEIETLQAALDDRNTWVAMRAAQALVRAGRTEALERTAQGSSARAELAKQVLAEYRRSA